MKGVWKNFRATKEVYDDLVQYPFDGVILLRKYWIRVREDWKDIPGFDGYQASTIGRIRGVDRVVPHIKNGPSRIKKRILKQHLTGKKRNYLCVGLSPLSSGKGLFLVHRLVAFTFLPNSENKPFINHKTGITVDNPPLNIEWCTNQENIRHSFDSLGRIHHMSKVIYQFSSMGKYIAKFQSTREAAKRIGKDTGYSSISSCARGERSIAYGYKWSYKQPKI